MKHHETFYHHETETLEETKVLLALSTLPVYNHGGIMATLLAPSTSNSLNSPSTTGWT